MKTLPSVLLSLLITCSVMTVHAGGLCDFPYNAYFGYAPKEFSHAGDVSNRKDATCSLYPFESVYGYLAYNSKFLWRGLCLADGSVLQPAVSFTQNNFTSVLWSNLDITDDNRLSGKFTRVDIVLDYSDTLCLANRPIAYSCGLIHYVYPSTEDDNTTEVYAAVTVDGYVVPTFTFFYDIDDVNGWYMNVLFKKEWGTLICPTPCSFVTAETSVSLGWGSSNYNRYYHGLERTRFLDLYLNFSLPTIYKKWCISPHLSYSYLIDSSIRANNLNKSANLWGGVTILRLF